MNTMVLRRCRPDLMLAFAVFIPAAQATTCIDYSHEANWISLTPTFSPLVDMDLDGPFVYLLTDYNQTELKIFDVSDLASPNLISSFSFPDFRHEMAVQGHRLLVAGYTDELVSCDVSDPLNVHIVDTLPIAAGAREIKIFGDLAYVLTGNGEAQDGLSIVRISSDGQLMLEGFFPIEGFPHSLDIEGSLAFVGTLFGSLCAIDISDPLHPNLLSCFENIPTMDASDLAVQGSLVYVVDGGYGVRVFDATDPFDLLPVKQIPIPGWPYSIAVSAQKMFVAPAGSGIQVFSLSQPGDPTSLGTIPGYSYPFATSGGNLFCAGFECFGISDATNLKFPEPLYQFNPIEIPFRIEAWERNAFILESPSALRTMSFEDPQNPATLSLFPLDGVSGQAMEWHNPYLYIATQTTSGFGGSLLVFKQQDQVTPQYLGSLVLGGPAKDVAVDRDIAYVPVTYFGVKVVDVTDPESPNLLGTWPSGSSVGILKVLEEDIIIATYDGVFTILDVSIPTSPQVLVQLPDLGYVRTFETRDEKVLVLSETPALSILDLSDVTNPLVLSSTQIYGNPKDLAFDSEHAYISHGPADLISVVDISNPGQPALLGQMPNLNDAEDIALTDDLLLAVGYASGLFILPVQCAGSLPSDARALSALSHTALWSPNPFQASTSLVLHLKMESSFDLELFDVSGRRVAAQHSRLLPPGVHRILWDGRNEDGANTAPGVYWSRIRLNDRILTTKVLRVR